jgi:hypothetical protein
LTNLCYISDTDGERIGGIRPGGERMELANMDSGDELSETEEVGIVLERIRSRMPGNNFYLIHIREKTLIFNE